MVVRAKWMLFYILVFLFSATAMFFMATAFHTVATQAENKENVAAAAPVIILDAGHGGEDGGAVSTDGTMEKDINLDITLRLRDLFAASGCKVILTRAQDTAIYDDGASTLKEKKDFRYEKPFGAVQQLGKRYCSEHTSKSIFTNAIQRHTSFLFPQYARKRRFGRKHTRFCNGDATATKHKGK